MLEGDRGQEVIMTAIDELLRRHELGPDHRAPEVPTPVPSLHLAVVTCMDARIKVFDVFGLTHGEVHILRNAGGRATGDAIRSLVVSTHLLGTREIGVIHHTDCGLEGKTDEEIAQRTGVSGMEFLAFANVEESVAHDVHVVRACGHMPAGVVVWGAVYDVNTGEVRVVAHPD